ncbi:MAG: hypothetical protein J6U16_06345 [Ruminococcus sp.]|nr:hypothetical protein [Ruminococcus sp.]
MHEKLEKGLFFGLIGNALFVAFGIICYIYYLTFHVDSMFSRILEVTAYCTEFLGFGLLIYSAALLAVSLRLRRLLKISYAAYIVLEALIMVLELNSGRIEFYAPYSMWLAIVHAAISGAACLAFLQLDPDNTKYEISVVICIGMIFFGMLGAIFGIRVYFSVITNAVSFTLLFGMIRFLLSREEMEIDCYGDRAHVAVYKSTMFNDPLIGTSSEKKEAPAEKAAPAPDKEAESSDSEEDKTK